MNLMLFEVLKFQKNERDIFYYGVLKSMTDQEWAVGNGGTLGMVMLMMSFLILIACHL